MSAHEIVILGGKRTAMAEYCGTPGFGLLKDLSAIELGAIAIKAALEDARVKPDAVDHVVMGNALQTSVDAHYGARHAALKAGIPVEVPALTVNRICGSGIQSIVNAAQMLLLGEARLTVAGGMENMSQAPFCLYGNGSAPASASASSRSSRTTCSRACSTRSAACSWRRRPRRPRKRARASRARGGRVRAAQPPARREGRRPTAASTARSCPSRSSRGARRSRSSATTTSSPRRRSRRSRRSSPRSARTAP